MLLGSTPARAAETGMAFRTVAFETALKQAGAGQLDDARALTAKLLAIDASAETKDLLRQHLKRSGHPELLAAAQPASGS